MPPRKSTSSIPPTDNEANSPTTAPGGAQVTEQQLKAQLEGVSVEDLLLPRSVTQRLAKSVLPPNTTIQKDALLAIQKAATVFVSYLSSHANEATLKRTLAPADILSALSELEFDSFRPQLERELEAHTEAQADKKKAKEKKAAGSLNGTENDLNNKGEKGVAATESIAAADSEKKAGSDYKKDKEKIMSTAVKGNKRVKRDSDGHEKSAVSADETELEEPDDDETEEEEEEEDDDDNEEDEDEEENDDVDGNETQSAEDLDRVEDLDARMQQGQGPDDDSGSDDDDDDGPAAQLRSNMGLG